MHNILIIIISLLLISCSEESDKSNNKNEQPDNKAEVTQEKTPQEENNDNLANDKWNTIVNPQDSPASTNTEEPLDTVEDSATNSTDISDVSLKQMPYKPTFNVSQNDIVLGNIKATVVVVEYFSPTCPHCAYYHEKILPELKKKYIDTNKIAYIIREFIGNKQDLDAAILARCPNDLDSFLKFQSVILAQQDKWGSSNRYRELLTNIAQIGGVSAETYAKCLSNNQIVETLLANTNLAASSQSFVGTPAFFVNGILTNGYTLEILSRVIDKTLENSSIKSEN
ncbi:DsbA family protein [Candidatus Tisiphia endosymbiont of Nedyus quadrimaculatus]|uniref:DsbA family protein n=1 Tax=Candidatus Tisiphia endosymbiont of Nedyus quadrimaculatus TaxID=3139332 RepID=UPI00345EDE72